MIEEAVGAEDNVTLPFRLIVESAHRASRAATIVAGRWEQGTFYPGDSFELVSPGVGEHPCLQVRATSIDVYRTMDNDLSLGMLFGVVVEGVAPADVHSGDLLRAIEGGAEASGPAAAPSRTGWRLPPSLRKLLSAI